LTTIFEKLQRISPTFWPKYSFAVENLNLNPLLKSFFKENKSCPTFGDRHEHFNYISKEVVKESPIDYLEFGVYKGDSIKEWIGLNLNLESRFFGFDTFTGLPEDWTYSLKRGEFDLKGNVPIIGDKRVKIVKGRFQETLRPFLKEFQKKNRMLIHLDADLYSSTLYVLSQLDSILDKNDLLAFDEFSNVTGEFRSFIDYKVAFERDFNMVSKVSSNGWLCNQVAFVFK
jgi:hypothetical protein